MPFYLSSPYLLPIGLLICSNLFMTVAWYGHLRFKEVPLFGVIAASWAIAFIEDEQVTKIEVGSHRLLKQLVILKILWGIREGGAPNLWRDLGGIAVDASGTSRETKPFFPRTCAFRPRRNRGIYH